MLSGLHCGKGLNSYVKKLTWILSRSCWCALTGVPQHGLLFIVGAMCSPVYCLPPPIMLPNHCFSCSTCVSLFTLVCLPIYPPGVCSPVLIRCLSSCVCYVDCYSSLPACMFFPFGVVFVHLCFYFVIKNPIPLHLSPRHLSPHASWQNGSALWELSRESTSKDRSSGEALQYPPLRRENWVRQALLGSRSSVSDGENLPHGHLLGRPGQAFQIPDALLGPRGVAGGLHQLGSEFKRLSLQDGVSCGARSVPWAHRVHPRARSIPWAHRVHPRARSIPWAHRVSSRARSVPWAHRVRCRAAPFREPTESAPEPPPFREPTESAPSPVPWAHRAWSIPWAHRVSSRARSIPGAHRDRSVLGYHRVHSVPGAHRATLVASYSAGPALASCSVCPALAPLSAYSSRPSSTPWAWPTVPTPDQPTAHPLQDIF